MRSSKSKKASPFARHGPLLAAIAAPLAACGHTNPAHRVGSASHRPLAVAIRGYAYEPVRVTVAAGTRITFANHDTTAHTATSTGPGFDTGTVSPGNQRTITISKPGTYSYICQFHPFMHGVITVANR